MDHRYSHLSGLVVLPPAVGVISFDAALASLAASANELNHSDASEESENRSWRSGEPALSSERTSKVRLRLLTRGEKRWKSIKKPNISGSCNTLYIDTTVLYAHVQLTHLFFPAFASHRTKHWLRSMRLSGAPPSSLPVSSSSLLFLLSCIRRKSFSLLKKSR